MEQKEMERILEAVLFVSGEPVPLASFREVLEGMEEQEITAALNGLKERLNADNSGLELLEIAEGWQLRTRQDLGEYIRRFHKLERSTRLSPASLEVLSIIAYKQPVTRPEVEDIRGVDSSSIIKKLMDRGLVKTMGRRKVAGKPMTFGTTKKFLEYFGLAKLSDMPTLKDYEEEFSAVEQQELGFEEEDKSDEDLQMEREHAMVEPAEEDYDDDEEEDATGPAEEDAEDNSYAREPGRNPEDDEEDDEEEDR